MGNLETDMAEVGDVGESKEDYGFEVRGKEKTYDVVETKIGVEDFEKVKVIGKGMFGIVYLVKKKSNNKFYAMKKVDKMYVVKKNSIRHIKAERFLLAGVSHPMTSMNLYLVMEYVNGGTLFQHICTEGRFSEKRVKLYAAELFLALEHLHKLNILHRDLKLENILLDSRGHIILTDFGLSKVSEDNNNNATICGTPNYISPEMVLVHKKLKKGYGKAIDWYALGILIYEMLFGFSPFQGNNLMETMEKVLNQKVKFPRAPKVSKEAKSIIRRLLRKKPEKRLGTRSSSEIRNHSFFSGLDWDKVFRKEYAPGFKPFVKCDEDTSYVNKDFLVMSIKEEDQEEEVRVQRTRRRGIKRRQIRRDEELKKRMNQEFGGDFSYATQSVRIEGKILNVVRSEIEEAEERLSWKNDNEMEEEEEEEEEEGEEGVVKRAKIQYVSPWDEKTLEICDFKFFDEDALSNGEDGVLTKYRERVMQGYKKKKKAQKGKESREERIRKVKESLKNMKKESDMEGIILKYKIKKIVRHPLPTPWDDKHFLFHDEDEYRGDREERIQKVREELRNMKFMGISLQEVIRKNKIKKILSSKKLNVDRN